MQMIKITKFKQIFIFLKFYGIEIVLKDDVLSGRTDKLDFHLLAFPAKDFQKQTLTFQLTA